MEAEKVEKVSLLYIYVYIYYIYDGSFLIGL